MNSFSYGTSHIDNVTYFYRNEAIKRDRDGAFEAKEEMHDAEDELDDSDDGKWMETFMKKKDSLRDQQVRVPCRKITKRFSLIASLLCEFIFEKYFFSCPRSVPSESGGEQHLYVLETHSLCVGNTFISNPKLIFFIG